MSGDALWSVKGIDPRARDAAREAARREGLSLGDWLNKVILLDEEGARGDDFGNRGGEQRRPPERAGVFDARPADSASALQSLDKLAERIETAEARSALAITGIDQSVYALVARLDGAERNQKQYNTKLESGIRELRATQNAVADRLRRMEEDSASNQEDLAALRRLGVALTALSTRMQQVEAAVADTSHLDAKLDAMAEQVDFASRELKRTAERAAERADGAVEAAAAVKDEVSGAVKDMAERLSQAETVTDAAVRALQSTVEDLHSRLAQAEAREGEKDAEMSSVTQTVMRMIDANREEVAREIAAAFAALKPGETESALTELQSRLAAAERRQLASFERIGSEIDRLAQSLDQRLRTVEDRNGGDGDSGMLREEMARVVEALDRRVQAVADRDMAAINRMGEEMARFAGVMEERVATSEKLTADAITQVGAQIEGVAHRLQERQENAIEELMNKMREQDAAAGARMDAALSGVSERMDAALANVSNRLDNVERSAAESPLHKALEALSERLRVVESAAPKALPKTIEGASASNTTAPRVSGWGMYDATPAAAIAADAVAPALEKLEEAAEYLIDESEGEELILSSAPDHSSARFLEFEDLEIVDAEPQPSDWDIDPPADVAEAAAGEADAPGDDLAALIELLDSAAMDAPDAGEEDDFSGMDVLAEEPSAGLPALDFTRPEPAFETAPADDEPLVLSSERRIDDADQGLRDEIADLDPELAEAIFGRPAAAAAAATPRVEEPSGELAGEDLAALELSDPMFDDDGLPPPPAPELEIEDEALELSDLFESALVDEDAPALAAANPEPKAEQQQSADYLQQARMAALASQQSPGARRAKIKGRPVATTVPVSSGGLTRTHILTAASIAAVAAIGAGTFFARETDPQKLRENLARAAPRPNEANAAAAPETVTPPPAATEAPMELANVPPTAQSAPAQAEERFPEAAPTAAPEAKAAALTPLPETSKPAAKAADAAPVYQRALEALRSGDPAGATMMRQAADLGYAPAQYRLAKAYERGEGGVAKNLSEARRWTERAARAGNRKAMHDLAVYFAEGEGGRQDYVSAVEWFRKAADYGLSDSQYNLGVLYEQGLGVSQDEGEALYWFEVAGRNGDQDAERRAREISASAPPSIVTAAMRRADVYKPRPLDPQVNGEPRKSPAFSASN